MGAARAAAPATADTAPAALGQHLPPAPTTAIGFYRNQAELGPGTGTRCHPTETATAGTATDAGTGREMPASRLPRPVATGNHGSKIKQTSVHRACRAAIAQRAPSTRGGRAPGEGFPVAPATRLAETGMRTGPHCSRRCRARGFPQAQHCSTGRGITNICRSHRLAPHTCGLWSSEWMLPALHDG